MSDSDAIRTEQFALISRLLIDAPSLDAAMVTVYLAMVDDLDDTWPSTPMATAFAPLAPLPADERERKIVDLLGKNPSWYAAAANILNVWYSGQLANANGEYMVGPPAAYLGALVWGLAGTTPSGMPGPFFGEWAYPPSPQQTSISASRGGS